MTRPARVRISRRNLLHNARIARQCAPDSSLMAVIKGDAYGHGAALCYDTLRDVADNFAVATISEARALFEALDSDLPKLTILHGAGCADDLAFALQHGLDLVLPDHRQLALCEESRLRPPRPMRLWLKVNTGMHRLGVNPDQVVPALQRIAALSWSEKPLGLMTHLAYASAADGAEATYAQLEQFEAACAQLREEAPELSWVRSAAASAGVLKFPESHQEWVRPGRMLYGPSLGLQKQDSELHPVMTLEAPVLSIRDCQTGDRIGYDGLFTCPEPMRIGIVEVGYADGYPRAAGGLADVFVGGQRRRTLGRVSMDMIAIDLNGTSVEVGDWVELWGENIRVAEVAAQCDTIDYEVLCNAGHSCRHV